jgi:hypothetical protein
VLLHPVDDSPFVGDVPRGQHLLAVACAMFRAPCHPHHMPITDFILIHSLDFNQAPSLCALYFFFVYYLSVGLCMKLLSWTLVVVPAPENNLFPLWT